MPHLFSKLIRIAALIAVLFTVAAPAATAHDDELGDGGPFTIEITSPEELPEGIEARWGNGEVEFHVPTGVELVALGFAGDALSLIHI